MLFALAACSTDVPARWQQLPVAQRATVIGSIAADTSPPGPLSRYTLYFRNIDTREEAFLSASPGGVVTNGVPALYEPRKSIGWLFDIPLAPGRYEFFRYRGVLAGATGSREWVSQTPFSVPFAVEAGKTYYLGEYRAYPNKAESVFGSTLPSGGYFVVRDQQARDVALIEQQRKAPIGGSVVNIVPDAGPANTPYLRTSP